MGHCFSDLEGGKQAVGGAQQRPTSANDGGHNDAVDIFHKSRGLQPLFTQIEPLKTEVYNRPWTTIESQGRDGKGSGFGCECRDVKGEGSGLVESECRDVEGEGSRSEVNQDQEGEGEGSLSGEGQGQDRGEESASGENQGGDRNAEGSGSSHDEDERKRQRRVRDDIEHGRQESNQEEIDFSGIPETFMAVIGVTTIAAIDFHSNGAISSTIMGLLIVINVFGFLCCMTSMLHRHRKPRAARIFGTIGVAAGGLGFLLLVSVPLSSCYRWMILGLGSLAILVISVWAFFPRRKDWEK